MSKSKITFLRQFWSPDESLDLVGLVGPDEGLCNEEVDGHSVDQDVRQRLQPKLPPESENEFKRFFLFYLANFTDRPIKLTCTRTNFKADQKSRNNQYGVGRNRYSYKVIENYLWSVLLQILVFRFFDLLFALKSHNFLTFQNNESELPSVNPHLNKKFELKWITMSVDGLEVCRLKMELQNIWKGKWFWVLTFMLSCVLLKKYLKRKMIFLQIHDCTNKISETKSLPKVLHILWYLQCGLPQTTCKCKENLLFKNFKTIIVGVQVWKRSNNDRGKML